MKRFFSGQVPRTIFFLSAPTQKFFFQGFFTPGKIFFLALSKKLIFSRPFYPDFFLGFYTPETLFLRSPENFFWVVCTPGKIFSRPCTQEQFFSPFLLRKNFAPDLIPRKMFLVVLSREKIFLVLHPTKFYFLRQRWDTQSTDTKFWHWLSYRFYFLR